MPTEKEILVKARDLLKAREYEQARYLLEHIPENPMAAKWLAKLDEVAPVAPPPREPEPEPEPPPRAIQKQRIPDFHPRHPYLMGVLIILPPIALILYALNWRHLGKRWFASTLGLSGLLWLGAIISAVLIPAPVGTIMLAFFVIGNVVLVVVLAWLQHAPYTHWRADNLRRMVRHQYPMGYAFLMWMVLTMLFSGGVGGWIWVQAQPDTFENEVLAVEYPADWEIVEVGTIPFCRSEALNCFLSMYKRAATDSYSTTLTFAEYSLTDFNLTGEEYLANIQQQTSTGTFQPISQETTAVNGRVAYWHDFVDTSSDTYFRQVFLFDAEQLVSITGWIDRQNFAEGSDDFWEIVGSVQLK